MEQYSVCVLGRDRSKLHLMYDCSRNRRWSQSNRWMNGEHCS